MSPWFGYILALLASAAAFLVGWCANNPPPTTSPEPSPSVSPLEPETAMEMGNKWLGELSVEPGGP